MRIIAFFLVLLVACTAVPEPEVKQPETPPPVIKEPVPAPKLESEPATRTVKQTGSLGTFVYGLTEDNRIVSIEKTGASWQYRYENGKLARIIGPQNIEFAYPRDRLSAIDFGATKLQFRYDSRDRLVEVKGAQETLY